MSQSQHPFELFAVGRHKEALAHLRVVMSSRELDIGEQVLLAELLCARGEYEPAMTLARQLLGRGGLTYLQRCKVRFTLGHCCFDIGNSVEGSEHLRSGAELAAQSGNIVEECRLRLQLFRNEIRWLGLHHAGADLDTLRRKVHQAGNASIALLFQIGLTELAAKLSLLSRARKHLETARALLPQVANLALHGQFRHTEVVITLEEGDSAEALRLALALAADESVDALKTNLQITIGHLFLMQSKFDEAERWLQRALATPQKGGGREIALLDTMMFLRVSQGELTDAGNWDQLIRQVLDNNTGLHDSSYGLWYLLTRVRWLYDLERFHEGMSVLLDAMPRIARMADRRLLARAKLLIAEGLGQTGRAADGASLVAEVFETRPQPPLEILAETSRVIGGLVRAAEPALAVAYYDRAAQIFRMLGHTALEDAVRAERQRTITVNPLESALEQHTGLQWIERIAAILSVGGHPPLLAAQTQALIADTRAAIGIKLVETGPPTPTRPENVVHIPLGAHRNTHFDLQVEPGATATDRATLLAITRIVRSSIDLAQARATEREQAALWPTQSIEHPLGLICSSERMLELVKTIRRVATSTASVMLTGETGVGKELFAKALHQASLRSSRTFLPFNCSTVPREMIDSQLFGHRRGSFTGATEHSSGVIRAAEGGTLFLDEIGEMSLESQPKLLRFLESGEILPLGDTKPQHVDVRIVAATNANLDQLVADGRFREDLYYRLNVVRINIPPLRERREEVPALVEHFLERFGRELNKPLLRIADETLEYLVLYRWPGNVRQLANEIRRLVAMAEPGGVIMPAHLSNEIAESRRTLPANRSPRLFDEVVTRIDQPLSAAVEHIERAAIQRALAMTDGHLDEAARILGLSRKGLYLKRQRLNLG
jgi:DNA-binding NtrC family response regulator/tetratricopeptide (TPR) repeat protein